MEQPEKADGETQTAETQNTTTPQAPSCPPKDSLEFAAGWLEYHGWKKEIAGEEDFRKACLAVQHYRRDWKNGLLLTGDTGCGKTHLAKALFANTISGGNGDPMTDRRVWVDCSDMLDVNRIASEEEARQLNLVKPCESEDDWWRPIMFLDDLGRETTINYFGSQISITGNAIQRFHTKWVQPHDYRLYGPPRIGNHLVVTTNMDIQGLVERYGERVMDRLLEMCAIVEFSGKSKRKALKLA